MNTQQYVWIAIVIVGIVGGIEIGYAISNTHHPYMMHRGFDGYGGWNHHAGYLMQDPEFRQQMYSNMFDSTQYREEMSQYLAEHPEVLKTWCETMMNNPYAMQTMQNMMGHGMMGGMSMGGMMGGMMHGMNMSGMMGTGTVHNATRGTMGMQGMNMSGMG